MVQQIIFIDEETIEPEDLESDLGEVETYATENEAI